MSALEILSAYRQHLITAREAIEQAGVESIEDLYRAAAGWAGTEATKRRHVPCARTPIFAHEWSGIMAAASPGQGALFRCPGGETDKRRLGPDKALTAATPRFYIRAANGSAQTLRIRGGVAQLVRAAES